MATSASQAHRQPRSSISQYQPSSQPRPQSVQAGHDVSVGPATHVQAIHAFDPAALPSTSAAAASNMYLCFKAGEIIKVWSRDEKGWWDGEVTRGEEDAGKGPRRGWFPSNYVRPVQVDANTGPSEKVAPPAERPMSRQASAASVHSFTTHESHASHHSRPSHLSRSASTATSISQYRQQPVPTLSSLPSTFQSILHPVVQSLRLLTESIENNHTTHFQPSTAVVISAIRTALEQTDCLSKTSPTLERYPQLAKERKIVLVELSKLVACARLASGVEMPDLPVEPGMELELLEQTADSVMTAVLRVMGMAVDLGVEAKPGVGEADETVRMLVGNSAPERSSSSVQQHGRQHSDSADRFPTVAPDEERTARWSARVRSPPPPNPRMQETFRQKSSSTELRYSKRASSPPPPMPPSAGMRSIHSNSSRSSDADRNGPLSATPTQRSSSGSGPSSPVSSKGMVFPKQLAQAHLTRIHGSIDSTFSQATASSDGSANNLSSSANGQLPQHVRAQSLETVEDMLAAINKAEDALYSIIAAFIGQIHSHSPTAHPSAHAGLVQMTKRTIDTIRDILTVTETLGRTLASPADEAWENEDERNEKENEVERLKEAKDGMYDLASRLVDAAENLADAPFRLAEQVGGFDGKERERRVAEVLANYEADREDLIRVASEGLKHGSQCAGVVRYCLMPGSQTPGRIRAASTPKQGKETPSVEVHLNSDDEAQEEGGTRRKEKVGTRGVHTLSGLHRRVESLGHARKGWVVGEQGMLGVPFGFPGDAGGMGGGGGWDGNEDGSKDDADEDGESTGVQLAVQDAEEEGVEEMGDAKEEDLTTRHFGLGYGLQVPKRPGLSQVHSSPLLSTPFKSRPTGSPHSDAGSQELTPIPRSSSWSRSRATSLSSPAPPRFAHRSPSRSADLDKFTSDLAGSLGQSQFPSRSTSAASTRDGDTYQSSISGTTRSTADLASRNSAYTMASFTTNSARSSYMGSDAARSSGVSALEQAAPQTPVTGQDDSPLLGYLRAEASLNGSNFPRLGELRNDDSGHGQVLDLDKTPMKPLRPVPHRFPTSPIPIPTAAADIRFWVVAHDYDPREIGFNTEGGMIAASLKVLIEKMTPHDGPVDHAFAAMFWDTFRLFTSPAAMVDEVLWRYQCSPPAQMGQMDDRERAMWMERKVVPTRLRCCNFLKVWLEAEWRRRDGEDEEVLSRLMSWNEGRMASEDMPAMGLRLARLIRQRMSETATSEEYVRSSSRASSRSSILSNGPYSAQVADFDGHGRSKRDSGRATNKSISSLRGLRRSVSFDRLRQATNSTSSLVSSNGFAHPAVPYSPISPSSPVGLPPTPIISKSLHSQLQKTIGLGKHVPPPIKTGGIGHYSTDSLGNPFSPTGPSPIPPTPSVPLSDFDPLELARQLTIMESALFRQLDPVDLLLSGKKGSGPGRIQVDELKQLSTLSNQITGFVADGVLGEADTKKRAGLLKFWIKVADRCFMLQNFSSLFSVLAGLNSSTILRLKKTWDVLNQKYKVLLDRLNGVIEHTRNHLAYRGKLREAKGPVLPFLGLILTDITFTCDGNPNLRPSLLQEGLMLINVDKYVKLGKIASDFRRYQEPFNFHEIEAVQAYLRRALAERGSGSLDALYRKSLMLEPRKGTEKINSGIDRPGWLGGKV
ncbi:uncharacterized protein MKK02DRAFT_43873 [Dioszegia hungarica]|uniref:Ras GEF n=1 Tax=Dioszegia hungarica TaxID=4972 RepID=A0AA38H620_9TREE|nr:uncharacterized protein MKK02DRAFT_43873 [Dioszegia hungarica]KAI9635192.1 hypothetical protein MKK02DRAFT_43873 [Dioszegia hungarica]